MTLFGSMPKRKRQVAWTVLLTVVFVLAAIAVVRAVDSPADTYRPGEEISGLTADLARDLPADPPDVRFLDVTAEAGLDFDHFGGIRSSQLPEDMGSGAAWGDYDGDGWQDLFLVNIAGPLPGGASEDGALGTAGATGAGTAAGTGVEGARSALFRNLGDGTFEDVTDASGIDHRALGMGAAWADYDGDGRRDLVVTSYGSNVLYRNAGNGTFVDVSREAGLAGAVGFWTGASWGDYDRDGDPDLYVTGYARYSPGANIGVNLRQYDVEVPASLNPSSYRPERNLLYRNEGDGTFTEVASTAGVDGTEGRSLSAAWADFDEDGWLDLYVANDVSDNALYRNLGNGTFEDVSHSTLAADYRGAMGLGVGDWDRDGDPDLFITHWIAQENALFSNRVADAGTDVGAPRRLQFLDEADRFGLGQIALDYIGWGTSFFDFDNDGWLDLFVANGSTFQSEDDPSRLEPMTDQLFWNRGRAEGFFDISAVAGPYFAETHVGRGAAFADYDRDGDVDVLVVNHGEGPVLLRNDGGERNAWLEVSLPGDPVGARVRVVADGTPSVLWVGVQSSYLSQNSPVLHFGLGDADVADTLEVTWPDGTRRTWTDIAGRRGIRIEPGEAAPVEEWSSESAPAGERSAMGAAPDVGAEATPRIDALDDRERIRRFWTTYREATRLRTEGDLASAARLLEEAHALDPAHEDALYYLGGVRAELGDPSAALEALDALVELNPRSGRGHMRRGALLACPARGAPIDLNAARQAFEAAEAINREQVGPALWLGLVALLADDVPEAARHLDDVLGSDHGNLAATTFRSYVAWRAGDTETAESMFERASSGRPAPADDELGLREGDTRSDRDLFIGAASCPWWEETLGGALGERGAPDAFERIGRRLAGAVRSGATSDPK